MQGMIFGKVPEWKEILIFLEKLEQEINKELRLFCAKFRTKEVDSAYPGGPTYPEKNSNNALTKD